ncbi:hypothetical protein DID88_010466 [Monilinia fructigena]|uniref:Major facilitator superfamily (MFS) profile domain-containing protein n=1 Tax=Monilinia fructigena TaxID=38457 RepID=A0A395ILH5_9HELO|nr:hypothetical protein DID88_010466 [Monilinia fructigena]
MAGIAALPETLMIASFPTVFGIVAANTGSYRWDLWIGWAITAFGCALSLAIQASALVEDAATAAGLFTFFRALGQTVGVAIGGGIFQNRMLAELKAVPEFTMIAAQFGYTLEKVAANVVPLIPLINSLPPDFPEAVNFKIVSAKSIKTIWVVMCGFAAAGFDR